MKAKVKKTLVGFLSMLLLGITCQIPSFAVTNNNSTQKYISLNDAKLLANQCVNTEEVNDSYCTWSKFAAIADTVPFYNGDLQVNSYLFRLKDKGKQNGYVFVDVDAKFPHVVAFGYDSDFLIDAISKKRTGKEISANNKIIYSQYGFFKKNNNTLINLENNEQTKYTIEDLQNKNTKEDYNSINNLALLKTNKIVIEPRDTVYDEVDLSDFRSIWSNTNNIFGTYDFDNQKNCTPTAATNMMFYFGHSNHPSLWTNKDSVYNALHADLGTSSTSGTPVNNILPGIEQYSNSRNTPVTYDGALVDYSYSSVRYEFSQQHALLVSLYKDVTYGNHTILGIGVQNTNHGQFLRIIDGWHRTVSNFYNLANVGVDYFTVGY